MDKCDWDSEKFSCLQKPHYTLDNCKKTVELLSDKKIQTEKTTFDDMAECMASLENITVRKETGSREREHGEETRFEVPRQEFSIKMHGSVCLEGK